MPRITSGRLSIGRAVPWILVCAVSAPWPHGATAETTAACDKASWRLDGASSSPDEDGSATYVEQWEPLLDEAAKCLASPSLTYACIEIQGQFDDRAFSPAVVTAFGNLEAAQQARARGRANAVQTRLEEKGVSPGRLRQRSPGRAPTFRGAMLTVVPDCLPRPPEMSEEDRKAIAEARAILENPPTRVVEVVREVPRSSGSVDLPLYLEAGIQGGLGVAAGDTSFATLLNLGLGARVGRAYGRLEGRIATETDEARRGGWGLRLAGGMALLPWLDLGVVGGVQWSSVGLGEAWLERTLLLGLEGRGCLLDLGERGRICLRQSVFPLGSVAQRAAIRDGVLETHPETTDNFFGAEIGVLVDYSL